MTDTKQWVETSLDSWIADCEADPSGFATWAAQRLLACRTQILALDKKLKEKEETKS